jgi:hypothetical protein
MYTNVRDAVNQIFWSCYVLAMSAGIYFLVFGDW